MDVPVVRTRARSKLWAVVGALACACASAKPPPGQPELKSIDIQGNHAISNSAIEDKIATTADSWIPFSEAKYLDRAVLETDTRRIERLYQAHGYFDAKVSDVQVQPVPDKPNVVTVKITVDEGAPSKISEVRADGLDALAPDVRVPIEKVLKTLPVGDAFDEAAYDAAKASLTSTFHDRGYALAQVDGEVKVDPTAHTASIHFVLQPGERYTFGPVVVSGVEKVPRQKVVNEVTGAAPTGSLYSDAAIQKAQNRVFDLNVFSLAKVTRGAPDPDSHSLPIAVDVTEAPFRTLRAGGGFGIERYRDEVRAQGEYINRNFFGGLRRLDWDNRLAYVVTPDALSYLRGQGAGGVAGYSKLTFTQPDLFLNDLDLNLTGQLQRDIQVGYTDNAALTGVNFEKRWGRELDILAGYDLQVVQLNTIFDPKQLTGSHAPQLATSCSDPSCYLLLSYLEQRVQLDLRDNATIPHKGVYADLDLQEGGGPGASFAYLRVEPEVRGYYPIVSKLVIAERVHWGWMKSIKTDADGDTVPTPLTQRFFGGGANDVRSYGSHLMSPVAVVCRDTNPVLSERHCSAPSDFWAVPVGGDGFYESSTELRYDVAKNFGVVTFFDAGVVPISPFDVKPEDIALAPGIGFRYFTLFGPIRLDFAYRLPSFRGDDGLLRLSPSQVVINYPPQANTAFASPGNTGRFDFQFSIGEAF